LTVKELERLKLDFRVVVEPQEYASYAAVVDPKRILTLPFSNLGQGSIPARNWVWDHSTTAGHERHWILDDNIRYFCYLMQNRKIMFSDGLGFSVVEHLADKFANVPMCGMQYEMFAPRKQKTQPLILNTRVYSCILLSNTIQGFRWRGRYNEDTDLSIRFLKAGYCTFLTYTCLAGKVATMKMKGGNTDHLYAQSKAFDGRKEMALSLMRQHPDIVKVTRKWNRWQHEVDYSKFRGNRFRLADGRSLSEGKVFDYAVKISESGEEVSRADSGKLEWLEP